MRPFAPQHHALKAQFRRDLTVNKLIAKEITSHINITDADVETTVRHLPELCAPGATVIWTRGRFQPDLTPAIREWFGDAGFTEIDFIAIPGSTGSVGIHRLAGASRVFQPGVRLFTFLEKEERPSTVARARD